MSPMDRSEGSDTSPRASGRLLGEEGKSAADQRAGVASTRFEAFFEEEHERLFGALYLMTGNRAEAEDLMQLAFLKVWEKWSYVQGLENPTGYLYRTAMNAFRSGRRRALVAARRVSGLVSRADPLAQVDERQEVDRVLATLSPRERVAVVLCELLEYPQEEAAQVMHIAPSTLRVLLARAKERARRELGAFGE